LKILFGNFVLKFSLINSYKPQKQSEKKYFGKKKENKPTNEQTE
tara:strand:- start:324 stop:455 length:132 start_codon:yes stop_codon:yes gene_type:complete